MKLKVKSLDRDDNIGVIKKSISIADLSITTPTKSIRCININDYQKEEKINEISKRIGFDTLENFHEKDGFSSIYCRNIEKKFVSNCINFVFFNLLLNKFPNDDLTTTLSHVIYSASDRIICLPTVQKAVLLSPRPSGKSQRIDDKKIDDYLIFQEKIINAIRSLKNSNALLGVIPLLAPKYTKKIINFYFKKEIFDFIIDAGTGDLLNKEPDLRSILGSINENAKENRSSLAETYIHAINLGIKHFSADEVSADDFLSLFAYIDTFGTKFKTRGKFNEKLEPRKKVFLRDRYSYQMLDKIPENSPLESLKEESRYTKINDFNEQQQFAETIKVKGMIGKEKINNPALKGRVFHNSQSLNVDCPRSGSIPENSGTLNTFDQSPWEQAM